MPSIHQNFKLHNTTLQVIKEVDANLSYLPETDIREKFTSYISTFKWSEDHRLVAVGDAGDCIIYENNKIMYVSDSG